MTLLDEIVAPCPHRSWDGRYCDQLTVKTIFKRGQTKFTFHLCKKLSGKECPFLFGKGEK